MSAGLFHVISGVAFPPVTVRVAPRDVAEPQEFEAKTE